MQAKTLRLVLVNSFGRNSHRPLRTALIKILIGWLSALLFGTLLARTIWNAQLPTDLPGALIAIIIFASISTFSALLQLPVQAASYGAANKLSLILSALPIQRRERWLMRMVPLILLNSFLLVLVFPIIIALSHALKANVAINLLIVVISSVSGIGFTLLPWFKQLLLKITILSIIVGSEAKLIEIVLTKTHLLNSMAVSFSLINVIFLFGFLDTYLRPPMYHEQATKRVRHLPFAKLLIRDWFVFKLVRNKRTRLSLLFSFFLASSIVLLVNLRHLHIQASNLFFICAILSATFAADVRGISRKQRTPEIVALKGIEFFIIQEILAAMLVSLIIFLPIAAMLVLQAGDWQVFITGLSMQAGAASIGLLLGTGLVPQPGDVGTQFFASIAAASSVFLIPKVISSSNGNLYQTAGWLLMATLALLGVYVIEFQRRRNYGIS